mgnify:CR=1 FL=1
MITCDCGEHLTRGRRCFGCGMIGRMALVVALVVAPLANAGEVSQVTFDRSTVASVAGCMAGADICMAAECLVETFVPTQPIPIGE